jgi:SAM-dependent methyltransferase
MGINYAKLCHQNDAHLGEKWGKDFWERQAYIAPDRYDVAPDGAIRLNLGCGYAPIPNFVNIDNRPEVNPDVVCDISKGLPYPDSSVDEIRAFDFIEHLERHEVLALMDEIYRVLKPHGRFWHQTPSDDGRGAWQDPHHKSCWNINTWRFYFSDPDMRKLYGTVANFKVIEIRDEWTDKENRVLHTDCTYEAIKEESCTITQ